MKTVFFILALCYTSISSAWWGGGYGPWGYGGWGGYPPYAYGAMGYGWGIQAPSFNYNTVIQQSPPIIINNNDERYAPPPQQYRPQNNCYNQYSNCR